MCENMIFKGFWIIPMAICMIMMLFFGIRRRKGFFGSEMFFTGNAINAQDESALEILTRRYAKGEITKEEFETIKKDI